MKVTNGRFSLESRISSRIAKGMVGVSFGLALTCAHAQPVGLETLHDFGACPNGAPAGPVAPGTVIPCYIAGVANQPSHNTDGAFPITGLTLAKDGRFFGIAASGMTRDGDAALLPASPGSIYSIDSYGLFQIANLPDGSIVAPLSLDSINGNFDGVASDGSLFLMWPSGETYALPGKFNTHGALLLPGDGSVVGVGYQTDSTFSAPGYGAIGVVSPSGIQTALHAFSTPALGINADGYYPWAGMTLGSDGNYYGVATKGGAFGAGTIFRVTPAGQFTTLHSFNSVADGAMPMGQLLMAKDGDLYGTTLNGGAYGSGTLFKIALDGTFTELHAFNFSDGQGPTAGLIQDSNGNFYGATSGGGSYGNGTLFKLTSGGSFSALYSFSMLFAGTNFDGAMPNGVALGQDGNLYGTTELGGNNGTGTVFELIVQKPKITSLKLSPSYVRSNHASTLSWSTTSATVCTASGAWQGSEPTHGQQQVVQSVPGRWDYTLTCTGPAGSVKRTVTLTVH